MKEMSENESERSSRRNFLKKVGVGVGAVSVAGIAGTSIIEGNEIRNQGKRLNCFLPMANLLKLIRMILNLPKRLLLN